MNEEYIARRVRELRADLINAVSENLDMQVDFTEKVIFDAIESGYVWGNLVEKLSDIVLEDKPWS